MTANDPKGFLRARPRPVPGAPADEVIPRIESREILKGRNQVAILHGGACYILRVTRSGKLILTK